MGSHQAQREWVKLQGESILKVRRGDDSFFQKCKDLLKLTDEEGCLLTNRQGFVIESSPDAVEICSRTIHISNVEGLCKRVLIRVKSKPSEFGGLDFRLLRKYRLDAIILWSPKSEDEFKMLQLGITDQSLSKELIQTDLDRQSFYELFENKVFQKRETGIKFEQKAYEISQETNLAFLVHLSFTSHQNRSHSSPPSEFRSLCKTLNFNLGESLSQPIRKINAATYMGTGKYQELLNLLEEADYSHVLFNCDLPLSVKRKLQEESLLIVLDRTDLILEIFNQHARSKRAQAHVELAQLKVRTEDMVRRQMENQQFASAKAYEAYQDKVRAQLTTRRKELETELERLRSHDQNRMQNRLKENPTSLALIGYTNAGKSTLFNQFLGREEVEAEDLLFKTLDTTTRSLEINTHSRLLISDTVGFIQEIPKQLMDAFYTTLAESKACSHVLILLDSRGIEIKDQLQCIEEAMIHIEREDKEKWIIVLNKVDLLSEEELTSIQENVKIDFLLCAREKGNVDELKEFLIQKICDQQQQVSMTLNYDEFQHFHRLKEMATILDEPQYLSEGIKITFAFNSSESYKIDQLFGSDQWRNYILN